MTRVKRGFVARRQHKKVLNLTKGFGSSGATLFRMANQRKMKAWLFAYTGRCQKKRLFRRLWISRINASARQYGFNYSELIYHFNQSFMNVNRKWLSQLAVRDPECFYCILVQSKATFRLNT